MHESTRTRSEKIESLLYRLYIKYFSSPRINVFLSLFHAFFLSLEKLDRNDEKKPYFFRTFKDLKQIHVTNKVRKEANKLPKLNVRKEAKSSAIQSINEWMLDDVMIINDRPNCK